VSDSLNFDLTSREIPVTIGEQSYVLREPTAAGSCKWRNALMKSSHLSDGKVVMSAEGLADAEAVLVSECLFVVKQDGTVGNKVHRNVIEGWPARVLKGLFARASELAGLDEGEDKKEESAKNEPAATPVTSA
jgi:hypothetical protein